MINRKDFFRAGTIKKTFGVEGELILLFEKEVDVALHEKEPIFPEISGNLVPFFIEQIKWHTNRELRLRLEDINTVDEAEKLTSFFFYLPVHTLKNPETDIGVLDLEGFLIKDNTAGNIGYVTDVIHQTGQDLLNVNTSTGDVLIPLAEEFILEASLENKIIKTDLPEGLLDIN